MFHPRRCAPLLALAIMGCSAPDREATAQEVSSKKDLDSNITDVLCGNGTVEQRGRQLAKIIDAPEYGDRDKPQGQDAYVIATNLQRTGCAAS
jgi:hypothetical protein